MHTRSPIVITRYCTPIHTLTQGVPFQTRNSNDFHLQSDHSSYRRHRRRSRDFRNASAKGYGSTSGVKKSGYCLGLYRFFVNETAVMVNPVTLYKRVFILSIIGFSRPALCTGYGYRRNAVPRPVDTGKPKPISSDLHSVFYQSSTILLFIATHPVKNKSIACLVRS